MCPYQLEDRSLDRISSWVRFSVVGSQWEKIPQRKGGSEMEARAGARARPGDLGLGCYVVAPGLRPGISTCIGSSGSEGSE
jgi:hypothetical protein